MSMVQIAITKTPPVLRVVSLYILIVSLLSVVYFAVQPSRPAVAVNVVPVTQVHEPVSENQEITGTPVKLTISRLGIDLAIVNGTYDRARDDWTLTDDAAQFASMTSLPNNKRGNTFLYGHNTSAVLEPVKDLVAGDVLTVTTTNGHVFTYSYVNDIIVTPDRTEVITNETNSPQVTLMTCEGWLSEARRIMYFKFEKVI